MSALYVALAFDTYKGLLPTLGEAELHFTLIVARDIEMKRKNWAQRARLALAHATPTTKQHNRKG